MNRVLAERIATLAISSFMLTGCSESPQGIVIDGSSTVYPITEAVAEEYRAVAPDVRVTVGFSGTGGGMKKFIAGDIDICGASRPIKDSERKACTAAGVEYLQLEVAFDGLTVVLNPKNDWCDSMTVAQLKELWRPESAVKKWNDLNPEWPEMEIKLYGPGTDSGTFDSFTKSIVGEEGASRADYTASEDDNVLVTGVQEDQHALGYFGYAYYSENKDKLKLLGVDEGNGPIRPSEETVRDGTYSPLSRPLYLYVRSSALAKTEVKAFIRFYLDNAATLSQEVGYVPVSDEAANRNNELFSSASQVTGD